jgi:hypothetical protein
MLHRNNAAQQQSQAHCVLGMHTAGMTHGSIDVA